PPLRDSQRVRRGRATLPGRRAGAGMSAVGVVSVPQVHPAKQEEVDYRSGAGSGAPSSGGRGGMEPGPGGARPGGTANGHGTGSQTGPARSGAASRAKKVAGGAIGNQAGAGIVGRQRQPRTPGARPPAPQRPGNGPASGKRPTTCLRMEGQQV